MLIKYLFILCIGSLILLLMDKISLIRMFRKSLTFNRYFFWTTVLIILMLFIPYGEIVRFNNNSALGVSRILRLFGFTLIIMSSFLLRIKLPKKSSLYLFSIYSIICTFSTYYSPQPIETLWKSIELFSFFLIALVLKQEIKLGRLYPNQIINAIIYILFTFVVLAIVGIIIYPDIAAKSIESGSVLINKSMWGIIPSLNPNTLGQFGAMLSAVGVYYYYFTKNNNLSASVFLITGLFGQYFAYSRTSIIAFTLVIILLFVKKKDYRLIIIGTLIIIGYVFFQNDLLEYISRGQDIELLTSMSGRTYMWSIAWESIKQNPWFGLGFYSGHKSFDINIGMEYSSLDSTYIEALVDVGVFGSVFLFLFVAKGMWMSYKTVFKIRKSKDSNHNWISFSFMIIMIIRSITGPAFQVFNINLYFLILIIISLENSFFKPRYKI